MEFNTFLETAQLNTDLCGEMCAPQRPQFHKNYLDNEFRDSLKDDLTLFLPKIHLQD